MMKGWLSGIKNAVNNAVTNASGSPQGVDPLALDIREKWSKVQRFYITVQNCDNEGHMSKYAEQLPEIEHTMNSIVELLVKDRHLTAQNRALQLQQQAQLAAAGGAADEYRSDGGSPGFRLGSMTSLSLDESISIEEAVAQDSALSPCYELLLGLNANAAAAGQGLSSSSPDGGGGGGSAGSSLMRFASGRVMNSSSSPDRNGTAAAGGEGVAAGGGGGSGGVLAGCEIIVRACQFAKHDQPRGSRRIMLHFLARLFGEADLPTKGQSLLQYGEEVTKPTLDLLSKMEAQLDPRKIIPNASGAGGNKTKKSSGYGQRTNSNSGGSATQEAVGEDHLAFVELLSVLCTKVEQLPSIFAYFITTNADHHWQTKNNNNSQRGEESLSSSVVTRGATAGSPVAVAHLHCFLVDYLLPYVGGNFAATSLTENQQVKLLRVTLSGLLSLLKTTDGAVQTTMQQEGRILEWLESQLRRSVLTLVMLPAPEASPNKKHGGAGSNSPRNGDAGSSGSSSSTGQDFRVMVQNTTEMVRFLDAMVLLAPTVQASTMEGEGGFTAAAPSTTGVSAAPYHYQTMCETVMWDFLLTTYDRLLRSTEERTFTAAAAMYRVFLQTVTTEPLLNMLGGFLLLPRAAVTTTASSNQKNDANGKSLFNASIVPKLRDLSVPVSCAALSLANALVIRCPSLFMRAVLGMHPTATTRGRGVVTATPSGEENATETAATPIIAEEEESFNSPWQHPSFGYYHDTRPLFCAQLISDSVVCGTLASGFVDEVQAKYIGIESMLSSADWADYRSRFSTRDPITSNFYGAASGGVFSTDMKQSQHHQETMLGKLNPSLDVCPSCLNHDPTGPPCSRSNDTDDSGSHTFCPFLDQLGECLSGMLEQPFAINTLVTQCWVSVLLLPHPIIAISVLQRDMGGEVEDAPHLYATTGSAAPPSLSSSGALATTLIKLSARIEKIFSSENAGEPFSRLSLYRRQVGRPFFDGGENSSGSGSTGGGGGGSKSSSALDSEDSFSIAMRQSKRFVEGCVVLEGFRHELSACLAWHEMGRSLTQLQPVDPFSPEN